MPEFPFCDFGFFDRRLHLGPLGRKDSKNAPRMGAPVEEESRHAKS